MKIKEAIILAGGLGTRLRSAVPDLPKCMAPVAGRPFIAYLIDYYLKQGIERFIFSLGYMHEIVEEFVNKTYPGVDKVYSVEQEPLGTGGAISLALSNAVNEQVLILNGDTFFGIDLRQLALAHENTRAACTLTLKPMHNFDRYGVVELGNDNSIKSFKEKKHYEQGLINGGVYALAKGDFLQANLPEKFSFEKDYLEANALKVSHKLYGFVQDRYFIDIGIPEDFERAQTEILTNFTSYE